MENNNKQVLSQLKTLVNNPKLINSFNNYLDVQIQAHYKIMEQGNDMITVHRSQGAVATLKRLKLLRDEVNGND